MVQSLLGTVEIIMCVCGGGGWVNILLFIRNAIEFVINFV